ncbi:MAG: sulfatase-like hydrolase/transferase, partial [Polyangiaceae bacterium]|nr:sulfatase-like hydrolase/transferase [Polyangiaceae bacterium]
VGKLIDYVRTKAPNAVVIVTADHGEVFGEHGMFRHAFELWEPLVRVPFFVHLPNQTSAVEMASNRSAIDVAPTVLECLAASSDQFQGRGKSLIPEWTSLVTQKPGAFVPEERGVYVDLPATSNSQERHAWIEGNKKIIRFSGGLSQAFDLASDPEEKKPLEKSVRDELLTKMKAFERQLEFVGPSVCKEDCLEGKYLKQAPKP